MLLHEGTVCPADLLLLRGSAVVDQADFTGEAAPVEKLPLEALPSQRQQQQQQQKQQQQQQMDTETDSETETETITSTGRRQTAAARLAALYANSFVHAGGGLALPFQQLAS